MKRFIGVFLTFFVVSIFGTPKEAINIGYLLKFNDQNLKQYIYSALEENHNLKIISLKLGECREKLNYQFAAELPSISVGWRYGNDIFSDMATPLSMLLQQSNYVFVPLTVNYTPDFFGKNHDQTKSVEESYESEKYHAQDLYISFFSGLTNLYVNILFFDSLVDNQQNIVKLELEKKARADEKFKAGVLSAYDHDMINREVEIEKETLISFQEKRKELIENFRILISNSVQDWQKEKLPRGSLANLHNSVKIPTTVPSCLIFQRPDVLMAEQNVQKAQIDVRVARKNFLPDFRLSGMFNFTNLVGSLFNPSAIVSGIIALAQENLFTGGRRVAYLKAKKMEQEVALQEYANSLLQALRDVNSNLYAAHHEIAREKVVERKFSYEKNNYLRIKKMTKNGMTSYVNLLDAKINLLKAQQYKDKVKAEKLMSFISLYKSMGGALGDGK